MPVLAERTDRPTQSPFSQTPNVQAFIRRAPRMADKTRVVFESEVDPIIHIAVSEN